jgi:glycosyltransferase involved in cell wall biosynthesis
VYRCSDVVVLTSLTEGVPGVVLEAAFAGVPVAATRVGAVPDLFRCGVAGAMFEPGDSAAATRAIQHCLAGGLAADTERLTQRYSLPVVTEAWSELLGTVIGS